MKIIVISDPLFLEGEEEVFASLFDAGLYRLHLRKPDSDEAEMKSLIEKIPVGCRGRISLHDHFTLAGRYGIGGVHLNSRNPVAPPSFKGVISRSCHSLEEIVRHRDGCDYLFLSPVFDSISKRGYESHFTKEELISAKKSGIIGDKVFALGGVTPDKAEFLKLFGFGGAALLGYVWEPYKKGNNVTAVTERIDTLVRTFVMI